MKKIMTLLPIFVLSLFLGLKAGAFKKPEIPPISTVGCPVGDTNCNNTSPNGASAACLDCEENAKLISKKRIGSKKHANAGRSSSRPRTSGSSSAQEAAADK